MTKLRKCVLKKAKYALQIGTVIFLCAPSAFAVGSQGVINNGITRLQGSDLQGATLQFGSGPSAADDVVQIVNQAKTSIWIQNAPIRSIAVARSIAAAAARGVNVVALTNQDGEMLYFAGSRQLMLPFAANMVEDDEYMSRDHIMIIDKHVIISGEWDSIATAVDHDTDFVTVVDGTPKISDAFVANFNEHLGHAHASYLGTLLKNLPASKQQELTDDYFKILEQQQVTTRPPSMSMLPPPKLSPHLRLPQLKLPKSVNANNLPNPSVGVSWSIDEFGDVVDLKVTESSGDKNVDKLALDEVNSLRMLPVWDGNKPIRTAYQYTFDLLKSTP